MAYPHDAVWIIMLVGAFALIGALGVAIRARRLAIEQAQRLQLLDQASRILASSLDYQTTIAATARLAVPDFADWCSVDVIVGKEIKQLGAAHIDTPGFRRMSEVRARHSVSPDSSVGIAEVIRTGETQFMPETTDEFLAAQARSPEHLAYMRPLGIRSAIVVPMIARGHTIGTLTVVRTRPNDPFDEGSLALARDLARRAAVAIDNAQLYRTAVLANQSKANFLATMSHELRTPLNAIIGYGDLLAEEITGSVNDAQRQQLERIKVSARQLLTLIEQILLHARIEAGRDQVRAVEVHAKVVVDDAVTVVAPLAHERGLALATDPIDPDLSLRTDPGKLRQMLINLLANAVKFTEQGSVTARAYTSDANVVFEVQDTGIGIAPEHLEHIFEAFWQVEQRKAGTTRGSGLGLSTTRQLARTLGGDVSVESEEQVGSTFRIVLPRGHVATEGADGESPSAPRGSGPPSH